MSRQFPAFEDDLKEQLEQPEFAQAFEEAKFELAFAASLTKAREKRGFTQVTLAKLMNSKQPMIARWEKGQVPQVPTLLSLAKALNAKIVIAPNEKILIETL